MTEGAVVRIDRGRKRIAVRFDNGRTEVFELTPRAALDAGHDLDRSSERPATVTVYYADETGHRAAHFFNKTSH